MSRRLTLSEMAARLGLSTKTLSKHVRLSDIPHIRLGRELRFNPEAVEAYLALEPEPPEIIDHPGGTIYLVQAESTPFYKIGLSVSGIHKRIAALQAGCPHELVIRATRPGARRLELDLHSHFYARNVRCEWFRFDEHRAQVVQMFLQFDPVTEWGVTRGQ